MTKIWLFFPLSLNNVDNDINSAAQVSIVSEKNMFEHSCLYQQIAFYAHIWVNMCEREDGRNKRMSDEEKAVGCWAGTGL